MECSSVDYSRVLQPQADGYDVAFFLALKKANGFVRRAIPEMPRMLDRQVPIGGWRPQRFALEVPSESATHYDLLESGSRLAAPVFFNMVTRLLDVLTAIECHDGIEKSALCPTARYPGAWIVITSMTDDPAIALRGIMHELMHQKLITMGFGTHASFLDTGDEFIANDQQRLHHSIVNSYADTMQPYMPAPIGRPMAACIHAYASFLAAAAATLKFVPHDARRAAAHLGFVSKWSERLDESWKAIAAGAQPSAKGEQLLRGLEYWTHEHLREYRASLAAFDAGSNRQQPASGMITRFIERSHADHRP